MKDRTGIVASTIIFVLVGFWIANIFNINIPIKMQTSGSPQELAVVGTGQVDIVPDTARVTFGIRTEQKNSVEEVQREMNTTSEAVIAALQKAGIKKESIKTSNYSINPEYDYNSPQRRLLGYSGWMSIDTKIQPTDRTPQVISDATAAGANEVQNTQFIVEKPEVYRAAARSKAIENARMQAESIAKDLGFRLGKAVNLIESSNAGGISPLYATRDGLGGASAAAPALESGTQTITSTVTVYFEKK